MGKGGSSSSSSTQTANYDQRVAAEGEGLALGSGAAIITANEFGDNVAKAYQDLVNFAKDSLLSIQDAQEKGAALGEKALDTAAGSSQASLDAINSSNEKALNIAAESSQLSLAAINSSNEKALNALVNIGAGAADLVKTALEAVKATGQTALTKVAENQETNNPSSTSIYKELFPWVAVAAVALIAIFIFGRGK